MLFSKRSLEGYVFVDHRASPGIPADTARKLGLDPKLVCEGAVMEAPTYRCCVCHTMVIMNPNRTRERAYCRKCDCYMCDNCAAAAKHPDWVHRTWLESAILAITNGASNG